MGFKWWLLIIVSVVLLFVLYKQIQPFSSENKFEGTNLSSNLSEKTAVVSPLKESEPENYNISDDFSKMNAPHWVHLPITYKFENGCVERLKNLMRLAFDSIKNETGSWVYFNETFENSDISIYCEDTVWADEGAQTLADASCIIDDLYGYNNKSIISARINVYGQGMVCNTGYPALEIHEILHTFGFEHNPRTESIMYPYSAETSRSCTTTKIDKEYISCLKNIYSLGKIEGNCSKIDTIRINNSAWVCSKASEFSCEDGWFRAKGSYLCCPKPNMKIVNSSCVY